MKRTILITALTALGFIIVTMAGHFFLKQEAAKKKTLVVGFVYEGDESTPYTYNFIRAQKMAEAKFGDAITVRIKSNVPANRTEYTIKELISEGCSLIFMNSYGFCEGAKRYADRYPGVEICQATGDNANTAPVYPNYHTFMGEIYQGRYIAGMVAGLKLKQLIADGVITAEQAKIGYVGAYPYAEVISGYTAFLLGIRSVVPQATMSVRYTNTWNSYTLEKICAQKLIDEGCVIISQHSDTIGPAVACEENASAHTVYHVGYNQSMIDVAPTTSLISARINWEPYIVGAIGAVLENKPIEKTVSGNVHGNDIGAGFELDWVQMVELNTIIAAPGTAEKIEETIKAFKKGTIDVFKGDYIGVNPYDADDTFDLRAGFTENAQASAPAFGYILKDVITIEE